MTAVIAMFVLSGCYSNFTGHMIYAPEKITLAHLDKIQDDTIWEADGIYYMQTPVTVYKRENNFFRTIIETEKFHPVTTDDTISTMTPRWISITPKAKKFLCEPVFAKVYSLKTSYTTHSEYSKKGNKESSNISNKSANSNPTVQYEEKLTPSVELDYNNCHGVLLPESQSPNLANAKKNKVTLSLDYRSPQKRFFKSFATGNDIPQPYIKLKEETADRYYLIPAALVTFPVDITLTIMINNIFLGPLLVPHI